MRLGLTAFRSLPVALLALTLATSVRAAIPETVLRGAWSEVRTRHVRVLTDAGLARARHVAERLERLHEQVLRTLPALALESDRPRTAFVFAREDVFRAYLPVYNGQPEEDTGLFQPGPRADWLLLQDGPDADLDATALHEYTHALLREVAPSAPLWLNEGLAQYFSTLRVDAADVRVGEPSPELVAWLRGHDLMAMDELLTTGHASADYHGGERRGTFYAESWLLVHMLLNENVADLPRWESYLGALHRGEESRAAFRGAFGPEQRLFWRLEVYAQRPSYGAMNWGFSQPFSSLTVDSRPRVPNVEVTAALGEMLLWQRGTDVAPAREHAGAAMALAPDAPDAYGLAAAITARSAELTGAPRRAALAAADGAGMRPEVAGAGAGGTGSVGGPPTAAELGRVSQLIHSGPPDRARAYLRALLARELRPGERTSIERLLRLLAEGAPGR